MKQDIFETRQRAKEILEEAVKIWRNTPQSDYLEGIEEDPIFSLLTMALAHQLNRMDIELKSAKKEVVNDFIRSLVPDSLLKAVPASIVVSCLPISSIDKINVNENMAFTVNSLPTKFRPILNTNIYNLQVKNVRRIDGLSWMVTLTSHMPIKELSGLAFAINNSGFDDLEVFIDNKELPLIKPWDSYNLPVSPLFSSQTIVYNGKIENEAKSIFHELFNRHNQRIFIIENYTADEEVEKNDLSLVLRFRNISNTFAFKASSLDLNPVVLANLDIESASLSASKPIEKIAGSRFSGKDDSIKKFFLHILSPQDEQSFESSQLTVRDTWAERYGAIKLNEMIQQLSDRLNSDFYAFQSLNTQDGMAMLRRITILLKNLEQSISANAKDEAKGVYLKFLADSNHTYSSMSVTVDYLITAGASINESLSGPLMINVSGYIDDNSIKVLGKPILGRDAIESQREQLSAAKYYFMTHNRIVTPADIKAFCRMELITNHGLGEFMIRDIKIEHRKQKDWREAPYEIFVKISLNDNKYLQYNFVNDITQIEQELSKIIESRSVNIYPVKVKIEIIKE